MLDEALNEAERSAKQSLKSVVTNFLGKHQSVENEMEIKDVQKSFHQLGT